MYDYLNLEAPAVLTPKVDSVAWSTNQLVIHGTNGTPGAVYYVMTTTNLALPLAQWTPIFTNTFDGGGNCAFTNAYHTDVPQQFDRIQVP